MRILIISVFIVAALLTKTTSWASPFTPIVFVHGMLASSDTWVNPSLNFKKSGYSEDDLYYFDWNTMSMNTPVTVAQLDSLIDSILAKTGKKKVNLVGHSAGGGICMAYLSDKKRAKKVEKYIHVASMPIEKAPSVSTLNLYSPDDKITGGKDYSGVKNSSIAGLDHYEIATSLQSFNVMYTFFNATESAQMDTISGVAIVRISGKVCSLGDNLPEKNALIEVYSFDKKSGKRLSTEPLQTLQTDEKGCYQPIDLERNTYYEFVVTPADKSKRKVHYYREPFENDNRLVYLRTMPSGGFAGFLLKALPQNEEEACLAIFSSNRAVIYGRDNLAVQGLDLARKDITPDSKTAIALFVFDDGNDKESSGMALQTFKSFPFMNGIDLYLPIEDNPIEISYNGRRMNVLPVKSSEAIMVVVFD